VRGKVKSTLAPLDAVRIIPACAGKSSGRASRKIMPKDHPRVCGEKTKKSPKNAKNKRF
jgi:hypothetical protein